MQEPEIYTCDLCKVSTINFPHWSFYYCKDHKVTFCGWCFDYTPDTEMCGEQHNNDSFIQIKEYDNK